MSGLRCPAEVVAIPTASGQTTPAVIRWPPGVGPFPTLIYLHGGLEHYSVERLSAIALRGQNHNRFLAAGYVVVVPTFSDRNVDPLSDAARRDCLAIVDHVKRLPGVDPQSVVLWGHSGGGSLALELAGDVDLCAIAAAEPASVLLTGLYSAENLGGTPPYRPEDGAHILAELRRYYSADLERRTRERLGNVRCPVFIAQGDVHPITVINHEIVIPTLRELNKKLDEKAYPGQGHNFSWSNDSSAAKEFFEDASAFFQRHLRTQPRAIDADLIEWTPADRAMSAAEG